MANDTFWNQLLTRSDSISDIDPNASDALEQVLAQLSSMTEQFDRVFDPADHFPEWVAIGLCQSLQRALTPPAAKPVCKVSVRNTSRLPQGEMAGAKPKSTPNARQQKKRRSKKAWQ